MTMREDEDLFGDSAFGRAALIKLGAVAEDFRIYSAGWLGRPEEFREMKVTGARFRPLKRGPRAGQMLAVIPGTTRSVIVTKEEIQAQIAHAGNLGGSVK